MAIYSDGKHTSDESAIASFTPRPHHHFALILDNGREVTESYQGTKRKAQNFFKEGARHLFGSNFQTITKSTFIKTTAHL